MLSDINFAARINCSSRREDDAYAEERNDVKGVEFTTYEMITRDDSLRQYDAKTNAKKICLKIG
ncbi:hypothetical protein VCV18_001157 [Metarhizium anisopliae]